MNPEAQEYYNIAGWLKDKVNYNRISKFNTNKRRQVLHGQIWYCDMGYNIGTEKNKLRPVLVMSNNRINNRKMHTYRDSRTSRRCSCYAHR